ncbi:MAG: cupin domain-containing protein [Bryobacterales bacterium]|nr:cupin domain-containing protein [Bryobacterales bacterium]
MILHDWSQIAEEPLNPLISRQAIHTERMTVARIRLKQGAVVPEHHHMHEQVTMVVEGRIRFTIAGESRVLGPGEVLQVTPGAPHSVEALADSLAVDLFSPVREDWIRGDDAYLRASR